jgi:hypothetical protein
MYDLILYFKLNIFPSFSEPCFQLQICADFSHHSPGTNQTITTHYPSLGITQSPPHSSITGDQESPRFFPFYSLVQVLKALGSVFYLCFHLIPGPSWLFATFSLTFNKLYYLPYYIHVFCLDASMWDIKNLGIFLSKTIWTYNNEAWECSSIIYFHVLAGHCRSHQNRLCCSLECI